MDSTVSISIRSIVITVVVLAAVVVAYAFGQQQGDGSAPVSTAPVVAAAQTDQQEEPTIAMTGSGEVTGVPDQLTFGITVKTSAADVSTALHSSNQITRSVLAALGKEGIARKDVQTTGLSIRPVYDYSGDGAPVLTGYAASQRLAVLVRSLPTAGRAISAVAATGANAVRVHSLKLKIGDEEALLRKARRQAVDEATAKATQYAEATGRKLGQVTSVREVSGHPRVHTDLAYRSEALDAVVSGKVPIRAGSADLTVNVSVVWSLA